MYLMPCIYVNPYGAMPYVRTMQLYGHDPQRMYGYPMQYASRQENIEIRDFGNRPYVVNIEKAAEQNQTFRTAQWTGNHFQVTLMSIGVEEDIGLEMHPHTDQFLRIEEGKGIVRMGKAKNHLTFKRNVSENDAIIVPAGTWHNLINTGNTPIKLYSIYAPPNHPFGTVHVTKADALAAE